MTQNSAAPNPLSDLTRVEDYLEVVYDLIQQKGYARSTDIAERLDVKSPSVTHMMQKLNGMGLIVYERYRGLVLTDKGEEMARFMRQKHATIVEFLQLLGVEEKTAKMDGKGSNTMFIRLPLDALNALSNSLTHTLLGSKKSRTSNDL